MDSLGSPPEVEGPADGEKETEAKDFLMSSSLRNYVTTTYEVVMHMGCTVDPTTMAIIAEKITIPKKFKRQFESGPFGVMKHCPTWDPRWFTFDTSNEDDREEIEQRTEESAKNSQLRCGSQEAREQLEENQNGAEDHSTVHYCLILSH